MPSTGGNEPATTGAAAMVEYLDGQGVGYELIEHESTMTAAAEAAATHRPKQEVAKTVVLQDVSGYVLAVVPASERLDMEKLRDLLGATRQLRLASEDEIARDFPALEVGAIPPVGPMLPRAEVFDRRLVDTDRIVCAGGDHKHAFLVDPRDLVRLADATVADICEE
jgi:Ala-tRNA(Pro) deacylase